MTLVSIIFTLLNYTRTTKKFAKIRASKINNTL